MERTAFQKAIAVNFMLSTGRQPGEQSCLIFGCPLVSCDQAKLNSTQNVSTSSCTYILQEWHFLRCTCTCTCMSNMEHGTLNEAHQPSSVCESFFLPQQILVSSFQLLSYQQLALIVCVQLKFFPAVLPYKVFRNGKFGFEDACDLYYRHA